MVHSASAHIVGSNAPYLYIKYWPADGSLEPKHDARYVLITIYVLCLTEWTTLSHCTTHRDGSYRNNELNFNIICAAA